MLTGYELSTDSLCRLSHALRASQNRNKTLKSQLHHMQEFVHMREAEVHHLRSKQSEFEKCKSTLFKTARLISASQDANKMDSHKNKTSRSLPRQAQDHHVSSTTRKFS